MHHNLIKKIGMLGLAAFFSLTAILSDPLLVHAEVDYLAEAEARKTLPIDSNSIANWPQGPEVSAEGAILMDANTGTVLYAKNIDEKLYPASTTKILTSLVAIENSSLDDTVTFSTNAVYSIEKDSSNMGMDAGQSITMEQCLYGILVYSANETCNAVAEHIAGDMDSYVALMNKKAADLGCTNSHFVTTNGLHDENHYTTPKDLATIACAFFNNETLAKMAGTNHYYIGPTSTQPDDIDLWTHNKLTAGTYPYEGYIGGKTGFTSQSRQTLVSCAERDGIKLVCVVMKEESPSQFLDTISLFDYGFDNFQRVNVAENESQYTISDSDLFHTDSDIFFSSDPIIEINSADYVIIPNTISFSDLSSSLSYADETSASDSSRLATINYSYQDVPVGTASITLTGTSNVTDNFNSEEETASDISEKAPGNVIFINVLKVIGIIVAILLFIILAIFCFAFFKNYHFARRRRSRLKRKKRRKSKDLDFYHDFKM